jgi:hypothetical protein
VGTDLHRRSVDHLPLGQSTFIKEPLTLSEFPTSQHTSQNGRLQRQITGLTLYHEAGLMMEQEVLA